MQKKEEKAAKAAESLKAITASLETEGMKKNRVKGADSPIPLRIDGDSGLPIYSAEQLKMGGGGGTALCPFDCDCCFG